MRFNTKESITVFQQLLVFKSIAVMRLQPESVLNKRRLGECHFIC